MVKSLETLPLRWAVVSKMVHCKGLLMDNIFLTMLEGTQGLTWDPWRGNTEALVCHTVHKLMRGGGPDISNCFVFCWSHKGGCKTKTWKKPRKPWSMQEHLLRKAYFMSLQAAINEIIACYVIDRCNKAQVCAFEQLLTWLAAHWDAYSVIGN